MGFLSRLLDRIEGRIERPPDKSALSGERNPGSESMLEADSPRAASDAAANVRRSRNRRRWRWMH